MALKDSYQEMKNNEQIVMAAAGGCNNERPEQASADYQTKIAIFHPVYGIPDEMWKKAHARSAAGLKSPLV